MPGVSRPPSRRALLRTAAAGGGLLVAGLALPLAGCAREQGPDELEAPFAAARSDAALARAGATAFGEVASRLTPVADARRAHADALAAEIKRARPDRAGAVDTPPPASAAAPSAAAALAAVRDALARAGGDARTLALRAEPYRSGLLASVAASCAGHETALTT